MSSWNTLNENIFDGSIGGLTTGQLFIGTASGVAQAATPTSTTGVTLPGNGTWAIDIPQPIAPTSSPTFVKETLTATSNQLTLGTTKTITITAPAPTSGSRVVTIPDAASDTYMVLESTPALAGQLLFGQSAGTGSLLIPATVTTSTGMSVPTAGGWALDTPQDLRTSASPTFIGVSAVGTTNQLVLGTTKTTTISATAPGTSLVATIPDPGGSCNFLMSAGAQTATGILTLSNSTDSTTTSTGCLVLSGGVGIAKAVTTGGSVNITSGGLLLPTTGGTQATLTTYSEKPTTLTWTSSAGTLTVQTTTSCMLTRVGKIVTFTLSALAGTLTSATAVYFTSSIDTYYVNATNEFWLPMRTLSNGVGGTTNGVCRIMSNGTVNVYYDTNGAASFAVSANDGWNACAFTWTV